MKRFKKLAAGMVAAGMALAVLPVAAAQADDDYGYDEGWSNPITISDVQVADVTDATADVTFKYTLDEAKFKELPASDIKITRVCFIVNVEKILTITPEQRFYAPMGAYGSPRSTYHDDPQLCANMVGDDVVTSEQEQKFYDLKTVPFTMRIGDKAYPEATFTMYDFLRGHHFTGDEFKKKVPHRCI
ncbi:hypothetical protein [Bifidobacterium pseudolongum]|uniref:hypothetical protein n=1 Tax=Bifidobacterium pseudolongum TaxID=1694 RepID=UPI001F598318|nr:hypothetical protein [Bifidobacterium pseudolongum]